jgi:lipoate-protein ligase A
MRRDLAAFHAFELGETVPSLRIYSWTPNCVSLGYAQKIESELDQDKSKQLGWEVIKRPTGGGIVFHNEAEVTYSLVMAKDDPSLPQGLVPAYKKISEAVVFALSLLGVKAVIGSQNTEHGARNTGLCFSYPAAYEVVVNGRKIVGSAQKRGKLALLQQGSIFVRPTPAPILKVLKKNHPPLNAISLEELLGRTPTFQELSSALAKGFQKVFGIEYNEV